MWHKSCEKLGDKKKKGKKKKKETNVNVIEQNIVK